MAVNAIIHQLEITLDSLQKKPVDCFFSRVSDLSKRCISLLQKNLFSRDDLIMLKPLTTRLCEICRPSKETNFLAQEVEGIAQQLLRKADFLLLIQEIECLGLDIQIMNVLEKNFLVRIFSRLHENQKKQFCQALSACIKGVCRGELLLIFELLIRKKNPEEIVVTCREAALLIEPSSSFMTRYFIMDCLLQILPKGRESLRDWLLTRLEEGVASDRDAKGIIESRNELQIREEDPLFVAALATIEFFEEKRKFNEFCRDLPKFLWADYKAFEKDFSLILVETRHLPLKERGRYIGLVNRMCLAFRENERFYFHLFDICSILQEKRPLEAVLCFEEIVRWIEQVQSVKKEDVLQFLDILARFREEISLGSIESLIKLVKGIEKEEERISILIYVDQMASDCFPHHVVKICRKVASEIEEKTTAEERAFLVRYRNYIEEFYIEKPSFTELSTKECIREHFKLQLKKVQNNYAGMEKFFTLVAEILSNYAFLEDASSDFFTKKSILESVRLQVEKWLQKIQDHPEKFGQIELFNSAKKYLKLCLFLEKLKEGGSLIEGALPSKAAVLASLHVYCSRRLEDMQLNPENFKEREVLSMVTRIIEHYDFLELFDQSSLLDQALYTQILLDPTEKVDPKHPYNIKKKCMAMREQVLTNDEMQEILVLEEVEKKVIRVNPYKLLKAKQRQVTYQELPQSVRKDTLDSLFEKLEEKISQQPFIEQEKTYKQIAYTTSSLYQKEGSQDFIPPSIEDLRFHFEELKNNFTEQGRFVPTLMHKLYQPNQVVSSHTAELYAIVDYILKQPSESAVVNQQEEVLLSMATSIQQCSRGQAEGITLSYNALNIQGNNTLLEGEKRVLFWIDQSINKMGKDLISSDNSLMRELTQASPIHQLAHQATYLENVIGKDIGLDTPYVFDMHSQLIINNLLLKTKKELLSVFYRYFTPIKVLKWVKDDLNRILQTSEEKSFYADVNEFFEKERLSTFEGLWSFQEGIPIVTLNEDLVKEFEYSKDKSLVAFLKDKEPLLQDGAFWIWQEDVLTLTSSGVFVFRSFLMQSDYDLEHEKMWHSEENKCPAFLSQEGTISFFSFLRWHKQEICRQSLYFEGQDPTIVELTSKGLEKFEEFLVCYNFSKNNIRLWSCSGNTIRFTPLGRIRFDAFVKDQMEKAAGNLWSFKQTASTVRLTDLGAFTLLQLSGYLVEETTASKRGEDLLQGP